MSRLIPLRSLSLFEENKAQTFSLYPGVKGIFLRKGNDIKGYINRCTHMGGRLEQKDEKRFVCVMHQAEFSCDTGEAILGQAPKGSFLTKIETVIKDDGIVYALVDLPIDPFA